MGERAMGFGFTSHLGRAAEPGLVALPPAPAPGGSARPAGSAGGRAGRGAHRGRRAAGRLRPLLGLLAVALVLTPRAAPGRAAPAPYTVIDLGSLGGSYNA